MEKLKDRGVRALRYIERYTKTDMVYLAKGGFWLGMGQFVASGATFLMSVAFANLLAPELYGVYKFVLSVNALILITTLTGMDSAVTQAVSRGFEGSLNVAVKEKMKWGILGSVIALGIGIYYYAHGNTLFAILFGILAFFAPFTESTDTYNSLLWGKKLFNIQAKYNVINTLIILVATTTTLFLTKNLYYVLFAYLLALTIPNVFFLKRTNKIYRSNESVDPDILKYGKHLSLINIMSLVASQLDKILVFHYVGAANLAVYSFAVAPTDQVKGLLKNLNSLALPKFSERTEGEIKKNIWHKVKVLTLSISSIVVVYIIIAPFFFNIFFPKYLASIHFSQVLSLSLIPVVVAGFLYTILEAQKATKKLYEYNLYSNIVNLIILFPLIYYFGIWGAIISRIITRTSSLIFAGNIIRKI